MPTSTLHLGIFYMPQICDIGPKALLPLRRKACWGFLKIRRLRPGLDPRTWVLKASTLPLDNRSRYDTLFHRTFVQLLLHSSFYLFIYLFILIFYSYFSVLIFLSLSFMFVLIYPERKFRNMPCLLVTVRHRNTSCNRQQLRHLRPPRSVGVNQLTDFH
jgi:hypothetical protein